jgi:hypothetical protein
MVFVEFDLHELQVADPFSRFVLLVARAVLEVANANNETANMARTPKEHLTMIASCSQFCEVLFLSYSCGLEGKTSHDVRW